MTIKPPERGEIRQLLVHDEVWPDLEAWLAARNIELCLLPLDGDDLPTYVMTPRVIAPGGVA